MCITLARCLRELEVSIVWAGHLILANEDSMHQVLVVLSTLGARAHDILLPAMLIARCIGHGGAIQREVHVIDRWKVGHTNVPQALD